MLFAIDDEFDSYTSAANLFSLQYEMYLHEQGKGQTICLPHDHAMPIPRRPMSPRFASCPERATPSVFYIIFAPPTGSARRSFESPVFDGRRLYDVVARMDTPQGNVTVPAGNFPASRIAIRFFDHGKELTDTQLGSGSPRTRRTLPSWSKPKFHLAPRESNSRICLELDCPHLVAFGLAGDWSFAVHANPSAETPRHQR